ncbi:MAG: glycosyltransferase, partial [Candidatus Gottesmanbacteria bacterium]|nr:glycosyltransferase [Candidatus Gottesmanbacteria bacterium]
TKLHSPLRFLASLIWNSFDFSGYDVIVGSSNWYITKGFAKKGHALEICYCHTPPRWLYGYPTSVNWQRYAIVRAYATIVGFFMRQYDFEAAQKVDYFIANSQETERRIQKFYRRDSTVIYPPATLALALRAGPPIKKNYYLVVSRLVGGKGLSLAVDAAKRLKFPLKIVGEPAGYGREFEMLKEHAGENIEFLGYVSDTELARLYAGAKAFLALATDEDFGMTPVEAMSMGTPVIAFAGGGYVESVIDGKTGIFFHKPTVESLIQAIQQCNNRTISSAACITQAKKFSKERFKTELKKFVFDKLHDLTYDM